ncbi:hypothetical protein HNR23_003470 [Nocardiopsis mwathae]|uniref:Uncharacterized protein n=1 Tax=Nocardiopsis mwathae TaxID=1472723 RepID=A0A7W9YJP7_9ACTN|nr:hypothetical protein [Nocardiopsis mwathae]MBB6173410.1 hypothetical protein [Nocardiopsis mwathae]
MSEDDIAAQTINVAEGYEKATMRRYAAEGRPVENGSAVGTLGGLVDTALRNESLLRYEEEYQQNERIKKLWKIAGDAGENSLGNLKFGGEVAAAVGGYVKDEALEKFFKAPGMVDQRTDGYTDEEQIREKVLLHLIQRKINAGESGEIREKIPEEMMNGNVIEFDREKWRYEPTDGGSEGDKYSSAAGSDKILDQLSAREIAEMGRFTEDSFGSYNKAKRELHYQNTKEGRESLRSGELENMLKDE